MPPRFPDKAPTILFLLRNFLYLRNFEAPIRELVGRGWRVVVLADPDKIDAGETEEQKRSLLEDLGPALSLGDSAGRGDFRNAWVQELQSGRDILRYREPLFENASLAKARAVRKARPLARAIFDRSRYHDAVARRRADEFLKRCLDALPPDAAMVRTLQAVAPALVIVSPMIDFHTTQSEWVRAARHVGLPSVLAVASWDNLSNKSTLHVMPDAVIVWNETQRTEAVEFHGVDRERVIVTGAQLYDHWFERQPSTGYAAFCDRLGLDPGRKMILYVGSSVSIAPREHEFVASWLGRLRAQGSHELKLANVLIRPHPLNQTIFAKADFSAFGPVAVHPRVGGFPVTDTAKTEYFDALHHAAAIVGLNTSAIVEATIIGRRCFTVTTSENAEGQAGTIHFHYLTECGVLHSANDFASHFAALGAELAGAGSDNAASAEFVGSFLRPRGLGESATRHFVDAVERLARASKEAPRPFRPTLGSRLLDAPALATHLARRAVLWVRS